LIKERRDPMQHSNAAKILIDQAGFKTNLIADVMLIPVKNIAILRHIAETKMKRTFTEFS
jgi:hypothetical protein